MRAVVCGMGGSSLAPEVLAQVYPRVRSRVAGLRARLDGSRCRQRDRGPGGGRPEPLPHRHQVRHDDRDALVPGLLLGRGAPAGPVVSAVGGRRQLRGHHRPRQEPRGNPAFRPLPRDVPEPAGRRRPIQRADVRGPRARRRCLASTCARCSATERRWPIAAAPPISATRASCLGAAIGALAAQGRDKLTLVLEPELAPFGAWVEQLIAESTGKNGTGIVPVDGEPLGAPDVYGDDRVFVRVGRAGNDGLAHDDRRRARCARGGRPSGGRDLPRGRRVARRRVLPLGVRHRSRRRRAGRQSVRRAQRDRIQGEHQGRSQGLPRRRPPAERKLAGHGRPPVTGRRRTAATDRRRT